MLVTPRRRTLDGLSFEDATITPHIPNRTDVACFVGFVGRRVSVPLPMPLRRWFEEQGWRASGKGLYARPIEPLLDIPTPIESWEMFDRLFDWNNRPFQTAHGTTYLGAAMRSFFAQGGKKCYVVRVGDSYPFMLPTEERRLKIEGLLPGFSAGMLTCTRQKVSGRPAIRGHCCCRR